MTKEEVINILKYELSHIPDDELHPNMLQYKDFCKTILKELEERPSGEWIPVSERLPDDGRSVLFCDIDNDIMVGYHVKGRPDTHFSQDGTYEDMKNVRAWMPLPEQYRQERKNEIN